MTACVDALLRRDYEVSCSVMDAKAWVLDVQMFCMC